jgi:hypothetical protein
MSPARVIVIFEYYVPLARFASAMKTAAPSMRRGGF